MYLARSLAALLAAAASIHPVSTRADPIEVVHLEGLAHGFVVLHALDGAQLASGELIQRADGTRVTTRLHLDFKDGSVHDETAVYTQRGRFRFVSDHVVQKGPAFRRQLESTIHRDGRVVVRYSDEDGKPKVIRDRLKLPPDVVNGMIVLAVKNFPRAASRKKVSYVAITPKPRLVELEIAPEGEEPFSTAGITRTATRYVVKVHVPGVVGVVATIAGKTPPDSHVWVLRGGAPVLVRGELTLAADAPIWRVDMVAPAWPSDPASATTSADTAGTGGAAGSR